MPDDDRVARKLSEAGVFAGFRGLEGLLNATEFWEQQAYGTRLYYGRGGLDYLHHGVLAAAVQIIREQPSAAEILALREEVETLRANMTALEQCTCKTDAEIGLCEKPCSRDSQPAVETSKQMTDDARLAVACREEAEAHRDANTGDYFVSGNLLRAAADAIERLQDETTTKPSRDADHCDYPDCEQHYRMIATSCVGCAQGWRRQQSYPDTTQHVHCPPGFIPCTAHETKPEHSANCALVRTDGTRMCDCGGPP